jgi:hypothetical protein
VAKIYSHDWGNQCTNVCHHKVSSVEPMSGPAEEGSRRAEFGECSSHIGTSNHDSHTVTPNYKMRSVSGATSTKRSIGTHRCLLEVESPSENLLHNLKLKLFRGCFLEEPLAYSPYADHSPLFVAPALQPQPY